MVYVDCACGDSFLLSPMLAPGWRRARAEQTPHLGSRQLVCLLLCSGKKKNTSLCKELLLSLFSSAFPALNHNVTTKAPLGKQSANSSISNSGTGGPFQRPSGMNNLCSQRLPQKSLLSCRFVYVDAPSSREGTSVLISCNKGERNVGALVLGLGH